MFFISKLIHVPNLQFTHRKHTHPSAQIHLPKRFQTHRLYDLTHLYVVTILHFSRQPLYLNEKTCAPLRLRRTQVRVTLKYFISLRNLKRLQTPLFMRSFRL